MYVLGHKLLQIHNFSFKESGIGCRVGLLFPCAANPFIVIMTKISSILAVAASLFTVGISATATTVLPYAASSTTLPNSIVISGTYDGRMK
jgi:hypothetical protein